jgi:hypothetical protein
MDKYSYSKLNDLSSEDEQETIPNEDGREDVPRPSAKNDHELTDYEKRLIAVCALAIIVPLLTGVFWWVL